MVTVTVRGPHPMYKLYVYIYKYIYTFQLGCQMVPLQGVNYTSLRVLLAPRLEGPGA